MAQNGKAIKARRIGGVKVVPKWNWTREYAMTVTMHSRALSRPMPKWTRYKQAMTAEEKWRQDVAEAIERVCA